MTTNHTTLSPRSSGLTSNKPRGKYILSFCSTTNLPIFFKHCNTRGELVLE